MSAANYTKNGNKYVPAQLSAGQDMKLKSAYKDLETSSVVT